MKESIIISILIIIIYIFLISNKTNLLLIETNGNHVLVRNDTPNVTVSAELLGNIITRLYILRDNMVDNKSLYPKYDSYIVLMSNNFTRKRTLIYENSIDSPYTSYSVNKGEEIVFCLRCKVTKQLHSLNLLMYVAIHELAHTACPEIGHPPLFNDIFKFLLKQAVILNLYYYENYNKNPVDYCGMTLYTNILN